MKSVAFTVADNNYLPYAKMLEASFKKFHPDIEFIIFGKKDLEQLGISEPYFRNKAFFGEKLQKEYDSVLNIDADSIVVGDLTAIFESNYDAGSVYNNFDPDPLKRKMIKIWDMHPVEYVNAGLVAGKSRRFWSWWKKLCLSHHYPNYQFREQDMLNIVFSYGDLHTVNFDTGDDIYGLYLNGYWPKAVLEDDKIVLPKEVLGKKKYWKVLHWAGGAGAPKMNYRTKFVPEVSDKIEELIS